MLFDILTVAFVLLGVLGVVSSCNSYRANSMWFEDALDFGGTIVAITSFIIVPILLFFCIFCPIQDRQDTSVFVSQKSYIESHVSKNSIEDAALTTEKIKLNDWLYNAQYWESNYPSWTFLPKEVKSLTPIE